MCMCSFRSFSLQMHHKTYIKCFFQLFEHLLRRLCAHSAISSRLTEKLTVYLAPFQVYTQPVECVMEQFFACVVNSFGCNEIRVKRNKHGGEKPRTQAQSGLSLLLWTNNITTKRARRLRCLWLQMFNHFRTAHHGITKHLSVQVIE